MSLKAVIKAARGEPGRPGLTPGSGPIGLGNAYDLRGINRKKEEWK